MTWVQAFANPRGKHQNLKKEIELVRYDFKAAAVFKEYCDRKDPFYTYKRNNKRGILIYLSLFLNPAQRKYKLHLI